MQNASGTNGQACPSRSVLCEGKGNCISFIAIAKDEPGDAWGGPKDALARRSPSPVAGPSSGETKGDGTYDDSRLRKVGVYGDRRLSPVSMGDAAKPTSGGKREELLFLKQGICER